MLTCGAGEATVVIAHYCAWDVLADGPSERRTVRENTNGLKTCKSVLMF